MNGNSHFNKITLIFFTCQTRFMLAFDLFTMFNMFYHFNVS